MSNKVLIIEDDDFLRSLAVTKLEKEGFVVTMAANGQEGLDQVAAHAPNLIILDLMLPIMSGFDVSKAIKANDATKNIKVIVFSNLGEESVLKPVSTSGRATILLRQTLPLMS
jgi:CheY-like chemotaxis protein